MIDSRCWNIDDLQQELAAEVEAEIESLTGFAVVPVPVALELFAR